MISCGLLNGIIRMWVVKTFSVIETELTLEDIKNADEIFLTNSLMGIMKVNRFEDKNYKNSDIIKSVEKAYKMEIEKQEGANS